MTEEEARKKWCPYIRLTMFERTQKFMVSNRGHDVESGLGGKGSGVFNCIGAQCMAWRWSRAKETKAYLDAVQTFMAETGENFNIASNKVWAKLGSTFEQTEGYCGLAGKPE